MQNILELKQLSCERGGQILFKNLSTKLQAGEALQIRGLNGSGKTSLLRMIAGISFISEGEIFWNKKRIEKDRDIYNENLLYIGHKLGLKDDLTAKENLAHIIQHVGQNAKGTIESALEKLNLLKLKDICIKELSAGQRRRVALAKLLLTPKSLWILDEPFTAVDKEGTCYLAQLMQEHCQTGGMIIFTSHQDIPLFIEHKEITLS